MATTMEFSFWGDVQLSRTLVDRAERAEDVRLAWDAIADRFEEAERRQFGSEGTYGSGGWAPLSPKYAAWKARNYPGRPILVREGDLRESLTERPFGVEVIEPHRMILGSDVAYGGYHQAGGGALPQRRPIELPEQERQEWVRILQRFLVTGEVSS